MTFDWCNSATQLKDLDIKADYLTLMSAEIHFMLYALNW